MVLMVCLYGDWTVSVGWPVSKEDTQQQTILRGSPRILTNE